MPDQICVWYDVMRFSVNYDMVPAAQIHTTTYNQGAATSGSFSSESSTCPAENRYGDTFATQHIGHGDRPISMCGYI